MARTEHIDFVGQEVACRTFGRVLTEWNRRGQPLERLVEGTGVTVDQLRDKNARISWGDYVSVFENARSIWDDEGFVELGLIVMDSPWAKPFTIPARLLYSAKDFYFAMSRPGTGTGIARRMFACVHFHLEEVGPRHLVMEATMEDGYPVCPEFFLITSGSLISIPTVIGLQPARVSTEEIEGGVRFDIHLPRGGGMLGWLRRAVSWPFTARAAARELEDAYSELHANHVDLKARVSERAAMENERLRLIADLEAKNVELEERNAELERFTYTVSHDLKSPLVTIKGFLGLLVQDAASGDADRMKGDIDQITAATDHLERLLNELLELSRIGRLVNPAEEVRLTEVADSAAALVRGHIDERGATVEVQPGMPSVCADRLRLIEVYQNLIENAVKFMGDQPNPRIEIGARRNGSDVTSFVQDNGIGIEPAFQERVFGLFDRLNQDIDGTGIGLALVRRIIEVHGGTIWVESDGVGHGSSFVFTLPVGDDASGGAGQPPDGVSPDP